MARQDTFRLIVETLIKVPTGTLGTILDLLRRIVHEKTGADFTKDLQAWLGGRKKLVNSLIIKWIGTVKVIVDEKFVAKEKFHKDSKEVKFYGIWDNFNFTNWFLAGDGKIEEPIGEQELRFGNLAKNSVDGPIIQELGGEVKVETTLTELYELLKKQSNGQEGVLLTNGYANIFYIRDIKSVLRAVRVGWKDVGWDVDAVSVGLQIDWSAGYRVFSRNS